MILYAAPAAVTLLLVNDWPRWASGERVAFSLALTYCVVTALLGMAAVLTKDAASAGLRRFSDSVRLLIETIGTARWVYGVVLAFALYAFHRNSASELGIIMAAWILTSLVSPLEGGVVLFRKIKRRWAPNTVTSADGVVVAYQSPGILLVRQAREATFDSGNLLAVHDSIRGARLALALDRVGRDEGILQRAVEFGNVTVPGLAEKIDGLPPDSVVKLSDPAELQDDRILRERASLTGLVAPDTTLDRLYFEVVQDEGLQQGSLVETLIGKQTVSYQVIDGLTKEEVVQQRNTHGFCRAQAQKLGEWDSTAERFRYAKWLPSMNAPVFLKKTAAFEPKRDAIGHLPETSYSVSLRSIDALVTHNAAILGILGVGKTTLALELVERMIAADVRVICIDLTNQYADELAAYCDVEGDRARVAELQRIGNAGAGKMSKNVAEGGSRADFGRALAEDVEVFTATNSATRLRVYNPSLFEVWRQDGKLFGGEAPMAQLTPAEITRIISEATLEAVSRQGLTDRARVCIVYEEAHSLVPEWNSVAAEADKAATNGTARAILQGRKYGLGCLLITQRTANVTKTILNQCHTIFAMRTFDDTGKEFLGNYLGKDHAEMLSSIEERHAVVFGKALNCENPVLIQLNDREVFKRVFRVPPAAAAAP